ncbi:MAG: cytochrome c3 family protein [bacterium]
MKKFSSFCLLLLVGIIVAGFISRNNSDSGQPIAYNHFIHVEENGMECLDCHIYAEKNSRASIPNIETCRDCHEEAVSESEEELTLVNYISENKKIPWRQIYFVPDHAYFSHRRHVTLGKLDCIVCHGDVGSQTKPVTEPVNDIKMDWCRDCHEERGVSSDCYACHR